MHFDILQRRHQDPNPPTIADASLNYVTVAINAEGTNGQTNSTFLDTVTGEVLFSTDSISQGTFSPFSRGGFSAFFNGASDYCVTETSNVLGGLGGVNFTVECWVFLHTLGSTGQIAFLSTGTNSWASGHQMDFGVTTNGVLYFEYSNGSGSSFVLSTGTCPANKWAHVAFVKNGATLTFFVDGISVGSSSIANISNNVASARLTIGRTDPIVSTPTYFFNGYISNLRITKGSALYSDTFTVSQNPLQVLANTVFLTAHDKRIVDAGPNTLGLTTFGAATAPFSPFLNTTPYNPGIHGGSIYFRGVSNKYLRVASSSRTTFGNGSSVTPFTIEGWVYLTATPSTLSCVIGTAATPDNSANGGWMVAVNTSRQVVFKTWATTLLTSISALNLRQWHHVAVSCDGSTIWLYIDGNSAAMSVPVTSTYFGTTSPVNIGFTNGTGAISAFLHGLRVTKGECLYPAGTPFSTPTTPPSPGSFTQLLLLGTNAGLIDHCGKCNFETVASARISNEQVALGSSSLKTGTTSTGTNSGAVLVPTTPVLGLGSGDFTIEGRFFSTTTATQQLYFSFAIVANDLTPAVYQNAVGDIVFRTAGGDRIIGTAKAVPNTWQHIALTRSQGFTRLYVDGMQVGNSYADTNDYGRELPLSIGDTLFPQQGLQRLIGYFDEFRVTRGVARYTANFIPPTTTVVN